MNLQTRRIGEDEFKEYFGIDLSKRLVGADNPSMAAKAFIDRETDRLEAYISARLDKNVESIYPQLTNFQKKHYKLALLEQVYYVFKNGEISADSGYDVGEGEKASNGTITIKMVAPNAKSHLIVCGIWNRNIYGRFGWGWPYGWH